MICMISFLCIYLAIIIGHWLIAWVIVRPSLSDKPGIKDLKYVQDVTGGPYIYIPIIQVFWLLLALSVFIYLLVNIRKTD